MIRVHLLVEGHTEENFAKNMLVPHFSKLGIYLSPRMLATNRKLGRKGKGGVTSYGKIKLDIELCLKQDSIAYCTTLIDLYGLPDDFPSIQSIKKQEDCYEKVRLLENTLALEINRSKFIPYIQLHEYESLLFSSPEKIDETLRGEKEFLSQVRGIREKFFSPEHINDHPDTAPSKRLWQIYGKNYRKSIDGPLIAQDIGLTGLRKECKHFNEWITKLEKLH